MSSIWGGTASYANASLKLNHVSEIIVDGTSWAFCPFHHGKWTVDRDISTITGINGLVSNRKLIRFATCRWHLPAPLLSVIMCSPPLSVCFFITSYSVESATPTSQYN